MNVAITNHDGATTGLTFLKGNGEEETVVLETGKKVVFPCEDDMLIQPRGVGWTLFVECHDGHLSINGEPLPPRGRMVIRRPTDPPSPITLSRGSGGNGDPVVSLAPPAEPSEKTSLSKRTPKKHLTHKE